MGEVPLSLHVDAGLMKRLEDEARQQHRAADDLALAAIANYLDEQDHERDIIQARLSEADEGIFVSEEAMTHWVDSWGTENELAPPGPDIFPDPKG
jgi:predicted transcriptional regulator